MEKLRIHKYLSQAGFCSRRKAEEYISLGLIKVNGKIAKIGQTIDSNIDKVEMLDKAIKEQKELLYFKVNKPRGVVTTCANIGEKTILDVINIDQRVFPIGRLDKDTTGLILMTNDGRLANFLMHPRYNHEKQYIVETFEIIMDGALEKMRNGLIILGSKTKQADIERISPYKFYITISQGKNRQIRRMVQKVGNEVKNLKRIRIENIELGNLKEGEYKELSKTEKDELFKKLNLV
ncbi:MAG: pseudouridine synthase [Candidatus Gracilibacteria bacterium]|nr:pseudouridine synthase [Candidatus Gracilibacteria bacterium]